MDPSSSSSAELPRLTQSTPPLRTPRPGMSHLLVILPKAGGWKALGGCLAGELDVVRAALRRQGRRGDDAGKQPLRIELPGGCLSVWVRLDPDGQVFDRHTLLRRALLTLFEESPGRLDIAVYGDDAFRRTAALAAAYVAWLNGRPLPDWKKAEKPRRRLRTLALHGVSGLDFAHPRALAEGNRLARELAWLPPNLLDPASYRARLRVLADAEGWDIEEYDLGRLADMGAGAFLAVARGSPAGDAAIVRLGYAGKSASKGMAPIALVGKGICFDTGGHNLKPARHMHNMHDDMNGSAVCVGILLAATRLNLPVTLDVWLAIAQNHISPQAYTQNEVVRALNGTTIEIVHTDAEGRMVLADALTLAARARPGAIVDFATLTGSMGVALGERMSGAIANRDDLAALAVVAGRASGERVVAFPMPEDYEEALESQVADVKQCTLEGEADHILAARFLSHFVEDRPWLHVDLSASRCKGGLGAVAGDVTGFGVALGLELLARGLT